MVQDRKRLSQRFCFSYGLRPVSALPAPTRPRCGDDIARYPKYADNRIYQRLDKGESRVRHTDAGRPAANHARRIPVQTLRIVRTEGLPRIADRRVQYRAAGGHRLFVCYQSARRLTAMGLPVRFSVRGAPRRVHFSGHTQTQCDRPRIPDAQWSRLQPRLFLVPRGAVVLGRRRSGSGRYVRYRQLHYGGRWHQRAHPAIAAHPPRQDTCRAACRRRTHPAVYETQRQGRQTTRPASAARHHS